MRPPHDLRRTLLPAIVGACAAAAVGAAAFGLQVGALPVPSRGELIGSDALGRLVLYRFVDAQQRVDGRDVASRCVDAWARGRRGLSRPAALVLLGDGGHVADVSGQVDTGGAVPAPGWAELSLAGCPGLLARRLGNRVATHSLRVRLARADGQAAYDLAIARVPARIDLFVSRRTLLPLVVRVAGRHLLAWSDVEVGRLRPATLRALRRVLLPTPRRDDQLS